MAKTKKITSTKRFGPRYGRTVKERLNKVEKEQKKSHKCPYCTYDQVKQQSVGIFICAKCETKFASKAYTVAKLPRIKIEEELA